MSLAMMADMHAKYEAIEARLIKQSEARPESLFVHNEDGSLLLTDDMPTLEFGFHVARGWRASVLAVALALGAKPPKTSGFLEQYDSFPAYDVLVELLG